MSLFCLRNRYVCISGALVLAISTVLLVAIKYNAYPLVKIERDCVDFGNINSGQIAQQKIIIRNVGKQPLVISKISSSCSCTVGRLEESTIAPNKQTDFTVQISGSFRAGEMKEKVWIQSNDPKHQILPIEVKAYVDPVMQIAPARADFGIFDRKELPSGTFILITPVLNHALLPILEPKTDLDFVDVTVNRTIGSNRYMMQVRLNHNVPDGNFGGAIELQSTDGKWKAFVPISGKSIGKVRSEPELLLYGKVELGASITKSLSIIGADSNVKDPVITFYPPSIASNISVFYQGDGVFSIAANNIGNKSEIHGFVLISNKQNPAFKISIPILVDFN